MKIYDAQKRIVTFLARFIEQHDAVVTIKQQKSTVVQQRICNFAKQPVAILRQRVLVRKRRQIASVTIR